MRVLLAVPSFGKEFGGPIAVARGLQAGLRDLDVDATLIGAGNSRGGTFSLPAALQFHGTPVPLQLHKIPPAVRHADIVHIIGYRDPVGTTAALAARVARVPYLLEPAGMHRRRLRSIPLKAMYDATFGRAVVGGARLIVATSRGEAAELAEDGIAPQRIVVRANGIDVPVGEALPPRGAFRSRLGLDTTAPLVLSLGRIVKKKGLPLLIEALARVPEAHLAIAGPDDGDGTSEAVRAAVTRFDLSNRVHLVNGGLWGEEKLQAIVDADLFCLFSMTENFGIAPAEAAACGTATIVSDQCGVAEWLGDGVAVVPYGDVATLADTMAGLLCDAGRRRSLAERGRAAARSLTWEAVARQQVELYRRAVAGT